MIGVIGDQHFKDNLAYADHISDRRVSEKKEILDFIVESFKDCEHIVFLGDNFNSKNNSSETNREFVAFLERFGKKDLYIISGNHEKKGDSKTAIDFIGEISKPNWHVFTKPGTVPLATKHQSVGVSTQMGEPVLKLDFLPYMLNSELGVDNCEDATKEIMKNLGGGDILFAHHAISGTTFNGIKTDTLKEVVLPKDELEKKYKLVVGGHIHVPQQYNKILVTGSLFTMEVGETEKFIWKIHIDDSGPEPAVERIQVPAREIHKLQDPTPDDIDSIPPNSIVKVIVTKKETDIEKLKEEIQRFDASLLIEDYPGTRKKMHIQEGAMDFSIEALLKLYSDTKDVDYQKLLKGLQIINA